MLLRGVHVELYDAQQRKLLLPSRTIFGVITDKIGEVIEPCQVLVCPVVLTGGSLRNVDPDDREESDRYYRGEKQRVWRARWSQGPFKLSSNVSSIWYWRRLPDDAPWRHEFSKVIRCYESTQGPKTYRLSLPKDCIITDSGFIEP